MLTITLNQNIKIQFNSDIEKNSFEELHTFYGEYFIERLCESISYHSDSKLINYQDFYDLYEYNRQLWKILSYYIVIWEESLISHFAKAFMFKENSKKKIFHPNQVKRGELYVKNIEQNTTKETSGFYNSFDESFGVFRSICCNPSIRNQYNYQNFEHKEHIRNIDKLNKYRNNLIHNVYVIISKNNPEKIMKESILKKLNILLQYLPPYHKKSMIRELMNILPDNEKSIVNTIYSLDIKKLY